MSDFPTPSVDLLRDFIWPPHHRQMELIERLVAVYADAVAPQMPVIDDLVERVSRLDIL